ncbi:hypothetical protein INS49_011201 [Diaporthe citri]|uniref:uncharacterized protein n=1 Tax=Diaporthe citri TaxID=83186 RepID=UPI001C7EAF9A|nr:uncharacterized protein INS49_011201 [Diaporthe citri]KAG6360145.1 hypothetical protein INS49_011201 [Diaporthe citri]
MSSFWHSVPGATLDHWLADVSTRATAAGTAIYGPLVLGFIYDSLVLGLYCSFVWRCPAVVLEHFYRIMIKGAAQRRESNKPGTEAQVRILDIGVATGYYMAKTKLPENTLVTLFDLNPNCLEYASTRCRQAHGDLDKFDVETVCGDFLAAKSDPSSVHCLLEPESRGKQKYDVIFTSFLLHCLPGPPEQKALRYAQRDSYRRHKDNTYIVLNNLTDDEYSEQDCVRTGSNPDFVRSGSFRSSLSLKAERIIRRKRN